MKHIVNITMLVTVIFVAGVAGGFVAGVAGGMVGLVFYALLNRVS